MRLAFRAARNGIPVASLTGFLVNSEDRLIWVAPREYSALVPLWMRVFLFLTDILGGKMKTKRLLTGDRPTGPLHLGHYVGSLRNRVTYQSSHECFFVIADLHTLTTRPEKTQISQMNEYIQQIVLDYLSAGIDPDQSTIFVQSSVPGITELSTLLGMLVSAPRLERIPSLKEMVQSAGLDSMPFGLLGYPVLMAADILIPRSNIVPVGELPVIELKTPLSYAPVSILMMKSNSYIVSIILYL